MPFTEDDYQMHDTFSPEDATSEKSERVMTAFSRLSSSYRQVIHLFYYEDLSIADISTALGETQATIKTRLSRAREKIRKEVTNLA